VKAIPFGVHLKKMVNTQNQTLVTTTYVCVSVTTTPLDRNIFLKITSKPWRFIVGL
jgi:hypothetical protein